MTERIREFVNDGLTFAVTDEGPADGDVVVLLHGFPQTSGSWGAVCERLHTSGYRTLTFDQRGYAPTARPRGRRAYRMSRLVSDVVALAEATGRDAEAVHHHPAVRQARRVDAPGVHGEVRREAVQQRADETDVVHPAGHRRAAAVDRVPGQQPVREAAGALGVDHDEALASRRVGEPGHRLGVLRVAGAAVQHEHERQALGPGMVGHANGVVALEAVVGQRAGVGGGGERQEREGQELPAAVDEGSVHGRGAGWG